ncbi:hypothetical protein LIER_22563 [Lithospermum erythrorhizon]|uniref:Uncharacterized protein n=1 Tax=Lithospermum erythrorhizon TaxID=34254 RepID=A0AAV3QYK0_LITER
MNDTRTRVNNKRIPKNVALVSIFGIALNSKDEEAKWKFIYNRRLAPERVFSDVTKRNMVIMNIIKEAGILSVVENVGPYWPKLVHEFICNLPRDVDDPESNNYHKVTLRNFVFNFSPDLINKAYGRTNEGNTGDSFLLSDIVSTLTAGSVTNWPPKSPLASSKLSVNLLRAQHPVVLAETNEETIIPKSFTISHKLKSGTHVADIPIQDVGTYKVITAEQTAAVKILQDEIAYLDGVIQSSLARKSILEAKFKTLMEASP